MCELESPRQARAINTAASGSQPLQREARDGRHKGYAPSVRQIRPATCSAGAQPGGIFSNFGIVGSRWSQGWPRIAYVTTCGW
jgi:hypothetical protein